MIDAHNICTQKKKPTVALASKAGKGGSTGGTGGAGNWKTKACEGERSISTTSRTYARTHARGDIEK
jgi:hypothetical protein